MTTEVFVVAAKRTPLGRFQGGLKHLSAPQLGAVAVKALLAQVFQESLSLCCPDELIMGQVLTAGTGQAPARQTALCAGLPESVPTFTVGKVCGSGLQSVILGAQSILTQESQIVIAGGQESMSNAPYLLPQEARTGLRLGHKELTDSLIWDGLWDPGSNLHMGSCAESCVQEFQLTRQDQDAYALESYKRARLSLEKGFFQQEIVPVPSALGNFIEVDEEPFVADLTKMSSLRPAFEKNGTITAGNASKINDGAAAVLLASGKAIQNYSLGPPLAQIIAWSRYADSPKRFAVAPIFAIENLLKKAHKTVQDIDLYEINEAFALVPLMIMKALGIPHEKVNVRGGACALGHPIGASGARILTTLLFSLFQLRKKYGLATVCIGGGEALAILVESLLP